MDNSFLQSIAFNPNVGLVVAQAIASIIAFIPRLLVALIVFLIARIIANYLARLSIRILTAMHLKQVVSSFQLGIGLSEGVETGIINFVALIVRYVVLYIGLIFSLEILGLTTISDFLIGLVEFLPKIISALVILFIGIVLAGFIEALVKRALVTLDPATARLGGKIASYTVVSFFSLMALGELGLAATFINTLFIGLVAALSLAFGLSIGLGAKDLVRDILNNWYTRRVSGRRMVTDRRAKTGK